MKEKAFTLNRELMELRQKAKRANVLTMRPIIEEIAQKQEELNVLYFAEIFKGGE